MTDTYNDKANPINERIAYIDFKLRFTGHVSRQDLGDTFGIAEAASSRSLSEYDEVTQQTNKASRTNTIQRDSFIPLINIDGETALGMLANGFNKNKLTNKTVLPYEKVGVIPHQLDIDYVAKITRAISGKYGIKCNYYSENSNNHAERTLIPLAIMYDGSQWMFRAYDRTTSRSPKFKNFHFSRADNVVECYGDKTLKQQDSESLQQDKSWNSIIPLELKLHESLNESEKQKIKTDFGISNNNDTLLVMVRNAFLWLTKAMWKIDDGTNQSSVAPNSYNFKLVNHSIVEQLQKSIN